MVNLLLYQNRFRKETLCPTDVYEVTGYQKAMIDFMSMIKDFTEFNPNKRYIDSVDLINSITKTSTALREVIDNSEKMLFELKSDEFKANLTGVKLSGSKVDSFLKEQIKDPGKKDI